MNTKKLHFLLFCTHGLVLLIGHVGLHPRPDDVSDRHGRARAVRTLRTVSYTTHARAVRACAVGALAGHVDGALVVVDVVVLVEDVRGHVVVAGRRLAWRNERLI